MIDFLFWLVGAPVWLVGGTLTSRKAIAVAERHYLDLSQKAWEKDPRRAPQDKMDGDDWIGALFFALGAFIAFPVLVPLWVLKKVLSPVKQPVREFMLPPEQKKYEQHQGMMEAQKQLVLKTAQTYRDVLEWEPEDHPDRIALVQSLQEQVRDQLEDLMQMIDPQKPSQVDYLAVAKDEIKELTAGR